MIRIIIVEEENATIQIMIGREREAIATPTTVLIAMLLAKAPFIRMIAGNIAVLDHRDEVSAERSDITTTTIIARRVRVEAPRNEKGRRENDTNATTAEKTRIEIKNETLIIRKRTSRTCPPAQQLVLRCHQPTETVHPIQTKSLALTIKKRRVEESESRILLALSYCFIDTVLQYASQVGSFDLFSANKTVDTKKSYFKK